MDTELFWDANGDLLVLLQGVTRLSEERLTLNLEETSEQFFLLTGSYLLDLEDGKDTIINLEEVDYAEIARRIVKEADNG